MRQAHIHFDTIDSTNLEARRRAPECTAPIWITADEQTAGIGRRGRAWSTQSGNFAGTLLMPVDQPNDQLALYSFVAALALFDTVAEITKEPQRFSLKWPNDVLMDGKKLAGILLEAIGAPTHLIIGIGVNLRHGAEAEKLAPEAMEHAILGTDLTSQEVIKILAPAFEKRQHTFRDCGFAAIREAWLALAAKRGETITARLPNSEITGVFETIDETGALILTNAEGRHAIAAGDVFF